VVAGRSKRKLGRLGDNLEPVAEEGDGPAEGRRVTPSSGGIVIPEDVAEQHATKAPDTPGVAARRRRLGLSRDHRT
jgi:hypothetical protein